MKDLISLAFKVYSGIEGPEGKQHLRDMIVIEGKVRDYPENSKYDMNKEERAEEESKGLYNISFYMMRVEFEDIVNGRSGSANDIGHNLRAFGEAWTFYDLDFPNRNRGVMHVPYVNVHFPVFCQRVILKAAKKIWKANALAFSAAAWESKSLSYEQSNAIQHRHTIDLSQERRNRWEKLYGCGKGQVEVITNDKTQAAMQEDNRNEGFDNMMGRVLAIAQNSTYAFFQTAKLNINVSYHGDDYDWRAYNPKNRIIMNGSITNHKTREGKADWSIHT